MSTTIEITWENDIHGVRRDPVVTYTIRGHHDVMRWCFHMLHGQVEFGRDAQAILRKLRRKWGAKLFDAIDKPLTGNKMKRYSIRPKGGV